MKRGSDKKGVKYDSNAYRAQKRGGIDGSTVLKVVLGVLAVLFLIWLFI